jgi:peptide/nickel transport system permease protein
MIPGDAVDAIVTRMNQSGRVVDEFAIRERLGMDRPAFSQFFSWIKKVAKGDLGESFFQFEGVWDIISRQLPISLELGILTLLLASVISIPLGLLCAAWQDSISDYAIRIISVIIMSIPMFWIATLILFYPAQWWGYSPPIKYVSFFQNPAGNLKMFLPPAFLGALAQAGSQLRVMRTMVLNTLRQEYIRTAYAKGARQWRVLFGHALRNAMIPVVTMIGGSVGMMAGGNVILENLFNIPGIGQQVVTSLGYRDYPMVQGCVLIMSLFVMVMNLLVDIAYKWIDPRVTFD